MKLGSQAQYRLIRRLGGKKQGTSRKRENRNLSMNQRSPYILLASLLLLLSPVAALADAGKIFFGSSGYQVAGRVEGDKIFYSGSGGGRAHRGEQSPRWSLRVHRPCTL
jgi:hypothetical protein